MRTSSPSPTLSVWLGADSRANSQVTHQSPQEVDTMATPTMSAIEAEHRAKLAEIKHWTYMHKREGQLARLAIRIDLLHHRADQLSSETKADLAVKYAAFKSEVDEVKAKAGVTSKEHRDAANTAWKELRSAFDAAYEQAGLSK